MYTQDYIEELQSHIKRLHADLRHDENLEAFAMMIASMPDLISHEQWQNIKISARVMTSPDMAYSENKRYALFAGKVVKIRQVAPEMIEASYLDSPKEVFTARLSDFIHFSE